jgi:hypothetical protein
MKLDEMFTQDSIKAADDDPSQDRSRPKIGDVRKTKLTLAQINRLRLMHDVHQFEKEKELKDIRLQFAVPQQQGV